MKDEIPNLKDFDQRLRDEANEEPTLEVPQGEPTSKTQIIAIYGKGGIGKSFTLANLSHMMAEMGKRVAHLLTKEFIEYFALDDDFVLIEAVAPPWLVGEPLGDTNLRRDYKVTIVCIKPDDGAFTYAESATVLGANDLIVVAGHRADIARFADTTG